MRRMRAAALLCAAATSGAPAGTVPCRFAVGFTGWTGGGGCPSAGATASCDSDAECNSPKMPGACCPHYGPGVGNCSGFSCVQPEGAAQRVCGMVHESPAGDVTPAGSCDADSAAPFCAKCNGGPCNPGSVFCASNSTCHNPSPAVSVACYPNGHDVPTPPTPPPSGVCGKTCADNADCWTGTSDCTNCITVSPNPGRCGTMCQDACNSDSECMVAGCGTCNKTTLPEPRCTP